jgi:hypothetical protein
LTTSDAGHRKWFKILGIVGVLLTATQGYYLYRDDHEKSKTSNDLQVSVNNLKDQTTVLMNAIRLQATLDDFRHLEGVITDGFTHLEEAIKGQKHRPPPSQQQQSQQLPPSVVEHVRMIQRRAASNDEQAPFGLQAVLQTDVTIQPVAFKVDFNEAISNPNVFIVGEGAYTMMATTISADRKSFLFSFHSPAFTPSASLVVSVQSKYDVRVTNVEKIQPIF